MKFFAVSLLTAALSLSGQDTASPSDVSPQVLQAVERGLSFLARSQAADGSFGNGQARVATTALAGLAFLGGGHTPGRSRYSPHLKRCVEYLIRNTSRAGYINEGLDWGRGGSGMHGHGYALLFLSQVYGMTEQEDLKPTIMRAVRVSEQSQWRNGGWYYHPVPSGDEGSVTVTQVQALRAVHDSGIRVNATMIDRAVSYIDAVMTDSGLTRYRMSSAEPETTLALTAAGLCVMTYLGKYESPKIERGLEFLKRRYLPGGASNLPRSQSMFYYGNYYATIAMYQAGGAHWASWWAPIRETLVRSQSDGGSWRGGESSQYGEAFGTALAVLTLEVPFKTLPIFQRGQD